MKELRIFIMMILLLTGVMSGVGPASVSAANNYENLIIQAKKTYKEKGYVWSQYMQIYRPDGDYLNFSFKDFANDRISYDKKGIPMVSYYGKSYYNPVTISQMAFSIHGRYVRTKQEKDLKKFLDLSNGLLAIQSADGAFRYQFDFKKPEFDTTLKKGWVSAMAQGQALSVFSRAYLLTGDEKYLKAGQKSLSFLMTPKSKGGVMTDLGDISTQHKDEVFFEEYVTTKNNYTLNGYMFTLFGLYDWSKLPAENKFGQDLAGQTFTKGIESLKLVLKKYDLGGFTTYDLSHLTMKKPPHIVPLYHSVHIYQLHALWTITNDTYLKDYSNLWIKYVEGISLSNPKVAASDEAMAKAAIAQIEKAYYTYSNYASINKKLIPEADIYKEYNLAKKLYSDAKKKLEASKSTASLATLNAAYDKYITNRVVPYIDAYTYAQKRLAPKVTALQLAVKDEDLDKAEPLYHQVSSELKAGTAILHKVYGADARKLLIEQYKVPAQKVKDDLAKPITVKMYYDQALLLEQEGKNEEAINTLLKVDSYLTDMEGNENLNGAVKKYVEEMQMKFELKKPI